MPARRVAAGFFLFALAALAASVSARTPILNSWVPYHSVFSKESLVYEKDVPIIRSFLTPGKMVTISDDVYVDEGKTLILRSGAKLFEVYIGSQPVLCTLEGVDDWKQKASKSRLIRLCFQRSGSNNSFQSVYEAKYINFGIPVVTKLKEKNRHSTNSIDFNYAKSIDESERYEIIIRYGYIGYYNKSSIIVVLKDSKSEFKLEENYPLFESLEGKLVSIAGAQIRVESWDGLRLRASVVSGLPVEPITIFNPI